MWRIVHSPFGFHLNPRQCSQGISRYACASLRPPPRHIGSVRCRRGAILAFRIGLADPELVYWTQSGQLVFMAVLGGFSNFFGPIVGALTFTLLQDQLQSLTEYWRFVLGAILALIVIGLPEGIAGLAVHLRQRLRRRAA